MEVRLRHECKCKLLGKINKKLTDVQKCRIEATPFKWLTTLGEKIEICTTLLSELVVRWDEKRGGFRFKSRIIEFTPLDVCLILGLNIVGEKVKFEKDMKCETRKLFNSKKVQLKMIFDKLENFDSEDNVDNFCRLYILLGLGEFYFSDTRSFVDNGFFKILDDLQSLSKYNWGVAIYEYLVDDLCRASNRFYAGLNSSQLHIRGCAVLLQIWALEHCMIYPPKGFCVIKRFPRLLSWVEVSISPKNIGKSFNKNVVEHLTIRYEEVTHEEVKQAIKDAPNGFPCWKNCYFDRESLISQNELLYAQNQRLDIRISNLEVEVRCIKEKIQEFQRSSSAIQPCMLFDGSVDLFPVEEKCEDHAQVECEDMAIEISDDNDDDGCDAEQEMHCEKKSFEVKVEVESEEDKECGVRPENPILISRDLDDDRYEYDSLSFSTESEDDDETSDDDYQVGDDRVECEFSRSEESDSFFDDDDDEREGCSKMVKERVRKLNIETESSGVWRKKGEKKKFSEQIKEEEEQWVGVDADCASVTSSKSEIRKEETKKTEEEYEAQRVESVNVGAEFVVDHCQSSSLPKIQEKIGDLTGVVIKENKEGRGPKDGFTECYRGKHDSVNDFSNELEKMSDDADQSQTQPSASRKTVPLISKFKKVETVERSESEKDINKLWDEMNMSLQDEGNKIGDATVMKKCERNNNVNDKGTRMRRVSSLPNCQEKKGVSAKVVINKDKKEREHKHWFNSNNRENKVRAVDDELYQVLRMPSKDRGFKFFSECFWGKQKDDDVDQGELDKKDGDVDQGQTQPLASRETVPLERDFRKKKTVEKSESEKELDMLWGEMDMFLRAEEMGTKVGNIETTEAREVEESNLQCKHDIIYDEEIGDFCRWCGWIETDIKHMWPKFVDSERSGRRVSSAEGNVSKLDEALFNDSGDDSEAVGSHNDGTVWDLISDIKQSLFPHQKEGFEFIWKNLEGTTDLAKLKGVEPCSEGGCIISHAPGTGKTRLTLVFLQTYLQVFPKCLPVIIAPANILLTWEDELKKLKKWNIRIPFYNMNNAELSGEEHAINDFDLPSNQQQNKDSIRMVKLCSWYKEKGILLISYNLYEKLAGGESEDDKGKGKKKRKMKKEKKSTRHRDCIETAMGKVLRDYPGILVLDEGHTPRNERSLIWKVLSQSRTQKRILLSGTPFQNNFLELYNILRLMKPSFPDSIPQELKKFCQSRLRQQRRASKDLHWEALSSGNSTDDKINQLNLLMNPFVHVHKGSILHEQLPGLRDCVLVLKPDILQQKVLDSIESSQNALNFEHKLALVSVHPSLFLNCSLSEKEESVLDKEQLEKIKSDPYEGVKTKFLKEFVKLCDAVNEKVLVFSQFIDTLNLIKDQLESAFNWSEGTEMLYMHGRLDQKQKQFLIHNFNDENSQAKVLLASIKACSEGINLIGASRVVLVDVVWNPSVERQAICRAYRLGQKRVVYTYHLLAQDTSECIKYCKQAEKDKLSELVFSNKNAENDKRKCCGEFEDVVLDLMVQHVNLKDMFAECLAHPKDRGFETLGS